MIWTLSPPALHIHWIWNRNNDHRRRTVLKNSFLKKFFIFWRVRENKFCWLPSVFTCTLFLELRLISPDCPNFGIISAKLQKISTIGERGLQLGWCYNFKQTWQIIDHLSSLNSDFVRFLLCLWTITKHQNRPNTDHVRNLNVGRSQCGWVPDIPHECLVEISTILPVKSRVIMTG